jgi:tripartite-type tricarboxylate transporter receptor subunit TctC
MRKLALAGLSTLLLAGLLPPPAGAQESFPNRPIRIVVQFAAGSAVDLPARALADSMAAILKSPVIVENRTGAAGQIAVAAVKQAAPDGYTILFGGQTSLVILPVLDASVGNPFEDLKVVALGTIFDLIMVTGAGSGITSMSQLVERMRRPGNPVTYVSPGIGTPSDITSAYFITLTGGKAERVIYKGSIPEARPDLMQGRVIFGLDTLAAANLIQEKKLVALAVMGGNRLRQAPDIPTVAEAGLPEMAKVNWGAWNALLVPVKTPTEVVDKLNDAVRKAIQTPDFKARMDKLAQDPINGDRNARQAHEFVQQQVAVWRGVIERAGANAK